MRKLLITLLLASAAASPAVAQDWGSRGTRSDDGQSREERREAREQRQQERQAARAERSAERPSFSTQRAEQQDRPSFTARSRAGAEARPSFDGSARVNVRADADARDLAEIRAARRQALEARSGERIEQVQERFEERGQRLRRGGDLRQSDRTAPNVMQSRNPLIVSDAPRPGTQPRLRTPDGRTRHVQWNPDWRNDHRYNWRDHRRHHRSTFRVGIYYDPFGWNYRPYQIGWRMWPSYYGSRYRISDPWMYRLPYAPPGYTWVRYWDDALLVDTWTGTVVDRIPNFFW
jgi:hypothetical protein